MMKIPRVACIHDLSGFGRCSLTTAISILSASGVQACPAPTAILSKHSQFKSFYFSDLTDSMPPYLKNWDDIEFDGIYSGFLGSEKQIGIVSDFITDRKDSDYPTCIIVDPVMGDNGKLYATYTEGMREGMKKLVPLADLTTPNITEACFLTDTEYTGENISMDKARELAKKIEDMGCCRTVLTGIVKKNSIVNMAYQDGAFEFDEIRRDSRVFSGTGDIFASVVTAFIMKGTTVAEAVAIAGKFISEAIDYTIKAGTPLSDGVVFEPVLYTLGDI